jgi:hypothetical protein
VLDMACVEDGVLARCFDIVLVNALANHPTIRPFLGDRSYDLIDFTGTVSNNSNIVLMGEHGGFLCNWCAPAVYEVHTMILPDGRGLWAKQAVAEALDLMWHKYHADKLWTRVALDRPEVRLFSRRVGWKHVMLAPFCIGDNVEEMDVFEMRSPLWQPHCQPSLG